MTNWGTEVIIKKRNIPDSYVVQTEEILYRKNRVNLHSRIDNKLRQVVL